MGMVMQDTAHFVLMLCFLSSLVVKSTWAEDIISIKMEDGCKLKLFTRLSHFMVITIQAQCFKLSEALSII